jgi:hypothetical protein
MHCQGGLEVLLRVERGHEGVKESISSNGGAQKAGIICI